MEGVEARPQSSTETPIPERAADTASRIRGPEIRESRPTAMVRAETGFCFFSASQPAKAWARVATTGSVRVTGFWPSAATPRMSVPLFSCFQFMGDTLLCLICIPIIVYFPLPVQRGYEAASTTEYRPVVQVICSPLVWAMRVFWVSVR